MITEIIHQIKEVPEYLIALKSALAVLVMGLPIYAGLRYFLYRRRLDISVGVTLNFIGAFSLFAGLAFLLASPLADHLPGALITAYLFITCVWAALGAVSLIDVFFVRHYLVSVKRVYISPPLRTVIKLAVFGLSLLPILSYVLRFNPLALVAIPTIATAALAFAFQDTFKAFIAGIGLGHRLRLGEWISFQDKEGRVHDINWGRTTIETVDGQRIHIPNSLLQAGIFMHYPGGSPAKARSLKICAPFRAVPERVKETLLRSAQGVPGVADSPEPQAYMTDYADSGILYTLLYWVDDYKERAKLQDQVATRVWHALQREGISIPYPTRTLQMQNGVADTTKKTRSKKSL
jgi:small-conductance mechanosensitive channel